MKTQQHRIEVRINALFCRWPALCGFTIGGTSELRIGELTVYRYAGGQAPGELAREIVAALGELIDECPDACELLHQRTFTRVRH